MSSNSEFKDHDADPKPQGQDPNPPGPTSDSRCGFGGEGRAEGTPPGTTAEVPTIFILILRGSEERRAGRDGSPATVRVPII